MVLNRGDICLVDFNQAKGGEMGKLRPAVILSDREDNDILDTVIVIPLSTTIVPDASPYRVPIPARDNLHKKSDACVYEIRALSKTRVKKRLAVLSDEALKNLQNALCKIVF